MATRKNGSDGDGGSKSPGKRSAVGETYDAVFRGYINVPLSAEQKSTFDVWFAGNSFWEVFQYAVSDGVNISVRIDPKSNGYLASATQRRVSSPNAGLVVTARASSADKAVGRLAFTLAILGHSERWEDVQPIADPDRW